MENTNETATHEATTHKFERAGLGKAPFRFVGAEQKFFVSCPGAPSKPGGTCAYCSNGILNCYHVVSADGRTFYVGSECIKKVDDAGLVRVVKQAESLARRQKAQAKAALVAAEAKALLEASKSTLVALPHPFAPYAAEGKTLFDSFSNRFQISGASGRALILRQLKSISTH